MNDSFDSRVHDILGRLIDGEANKEELAAFKRGMDAWARRAKESEVAWAPYVVKDG